MGTVPNSRMGGRARGAVTNAQLMWGLGGVVAGMLLVVLAQIWLLPAPPLPPAARHGTADVTVTITDAYLSDAAGDALAHAGLPVPVSNVRAHITPGNIVTLAGDLATLPGGGPRHVQAVAQVSVIDGQIAIHMVDGSIGGLAIPAPMLAIAQSAINDRLRAAVPALSTGSRTYRVTSMSSTSGSLTVTVGPE